MCKDSCVRCRESELNTKCNQSVTHAQYALVRILHFLSNFQLEKKEDNKWNGPKKHRPRGGEPQDRIINLNLNFKYFI
jgi:hypothetical protein